MHSPRTYGRVDAHRCERVCLEFLVAMAGTIHLLLVKLRDLVACVCPREVFPLPWGSCTRIRLVG